MNEKSIDSILVSINQLIIKGQLNVAHKLVASTFKKKLNRSQKLILASLARRSGQALLGLKILYPIVRPKIKNPVAATYEEKAEYAANLVRVGLNAEALNLLNTIPENESYKSLLFKSFAYVSNWDYQLSIEPLEKVIQNKDSSLYDRMVAKVNLAAALQELKQTAKGIHFTEELLDELKNHNFQFLHSTALEIYAWLLIDAQKYNIASKIISHAKSLLEKSTSIDYFLLNKADIILNCLQSKSKKNIVELLLRLKKDAISISHYESIRDIDFWYAKLTKNKNLFRHLYFGTPYQSYKQKIVTECPSVLNENSVYVFNAKMQPSKIINPTIDLNLGLMNGKILLKQGQKLWRLQLEIFKDFYRPSTTMAIYQEVFQGQQFNHETSFNQIHQLLHRLKCIWKNNKLEIGIRIDNNKIYLHGMRNLIAITTSNDLNVRIKGNPMLQKMYSFFDYHKKINKTEFTRKEFQEINQLTERTAIRYLNFASSNGMIKNIGNFRYVLSI